MKSNKGVRCRNSEVDGALQVQLSLSAKQSCTSTLRTEFSFYVMKNKQIYIYIFCILYVRANLGADPTKILLSQWITKKIFFIEIELQKRTTHTYINN